MASWDRTDGFYSLGLYCVPKYLIREPEDWNLGVERLIEKYFPNW